VIGGFIVQWLTTKAGQAHKIDKRAVQSISAVALDALLVCAIGTMSLATLGSNVPAVVAFTVIGVVWRVVTTVWFGRRFLPDALVRALHRQLRQSHGNVATGFVLADMVDPQGQTSTANDYGYKQLL